MPFYILSKGKLNQIPFDYLSKESGVRLEKTIGNQEPKHLKQECSSQTYAIEIMSKPVLSLDHESSAGEVLKLLKEKSIHHIVLVNGEEVKGLLSDRDLSWLKKLKLDEHATASQFMSSIILACDENTPIDHLAKVMVKEHISALPVVNNNQELTGIVTHHDILRWLF
jgi:CBS domain-containing protein